jgi:hypothetical protein
MNSDRLWQLPAALRAGPGGTLIADTVTWLDRAVRDGLAGELDETLYPLLFPAMFDDLFDELDGADASRLALADRHQTALAVARRALVGDNLNVDDLLSLAALSSWVRRLAPQLPPLVLASEAFTVMHMWAVGVVSETLGLHDPA